MSRSDKRGADQLIVFNATRIGVSVVKCSEMMPLTRRCFETHSHRDVYCVCECVRAEAVTGTQRETV